jgi:hypothetical protein
MAPFALVARPRVVLFPRAVYEQALLYLQTTWTIPVPCSHKMILSGLFGGEKDNIHA